MSETTAPTLPLSSLSTSPEQIALALTVALVRTPEMSMAPAEAVRIYREALAQLQATAEG